MKCRCNEVSELRDSEANQYASYHLKKIGSKNGGWEVYFECPLTGIQWVSEYPHSEWPGGGPLLLHRLDSTESRQPTDS